MAKILIDVSTDTSLIHAAMTTPVTTFGGMGSVGVVLCLTHDDGSPYPELKQKNVKIQLIKIGSTPYHVSISMFQEWSKEFPSDGVIQGLYLLLITRQQEETWPPGVYDLAIQVQHGFDYGQTITQFQIRQDQTLA